MAFKKKTSFYDVVKTLDFHRENKKEDFVIKIGEVRKAIRIPGKRIEKGSVIGYTWTIYKKYKVDDEEFLDDVASYGEYEESIEDAERIAIDIMKKNFKF